MKTRCAAAAALGLLVAASWSCAAPAFEKALPEDTIAFVSVRSMPAFQQHLKADPLYAIWQEPSVQKFLEKPVESLRQHMTEAEGKAGIKFDEIWSLFHGQVALAVTTDPNDSDKPDLTVLVEVGNDGDRAMQLMALIEAASNKGPEAPKAGGGRGDLRGREAHPRAARGRQPRQERRATRHVRRRRRRVHPVRFR